MNTPADRNYVARLLADAEATTFCDDAQRYRELLDHCAEVEQERDVARREREEIIQDLLKERRKNRTLSTWCLLLVVFAAAAVVLGGVMAMGRIQ